jgi:hypothetical protein
VQAACRILCGDELAPPGFATTRQAAIHLRQPAPHPALGGAELNAQPLGEFTVCQSLEVDESDRTPVIERQVREASFDLTRLFATHRLIGGTRAVDDHLLDIEHGVLAVPQDLGPRRQRAIAHHPDQPSISRTLVGVVTVGPAPNADEGFLQHILGDIAATDYAAGDGKQAAAGQLIKAGKGAFIAQRYVGQKHRQGIKRGALFDRT